MTGKLQSGRTKAKVVSDLKRSAKRIRTSKSTTKRLEDDTDRATLPKHHSNSKSISTETHAIANGGDLLGLNPHSRLVEALSPYSPLFGILWPIIVEQASFQTRDLLRKVNTYFEALCHPYRHSDQAKRSYALYREGRPLVLDLSFGVEWRCWGTRVCLFSNIDSFRAFCAVGDIDPDQGDVWDPYGGRRRSRTPTTRHIWMSRTKDVVFETSLDPLDPCYDRFAFRLGLTGIADKAIAMYDFMYRHRVNSDNSEACSEDKPVIGTDWAELTWDRKYC